MVLPPPYRVSRPRAPYSQSSPPEPGPPPGEWRGRIRTSRGREHGDPFHAGARFGRGTIAQGRVQPLPVVEHLDIVEHRRPGLIAGAEPGPVDGNRAPWTCSFFSEAKKLSMGALSRQLPRRLIDCSTPCRSST